jgi:hypothetical protein
MKTILFLLVIGISFLAVSKEVKKLHYNYNDNVTIWISNEECPLPLSKKQFPWKVEAIRSDGDIMIGCFNGENNTVTIANNNNMPINCYYYVVGERKDIPKLIVQP